LEVAARLGEGGTLPADLIVDVKRLSGLVEDLLLLARADADTKPPARLRSLDAGDLVSEVVREYADARIVVTIAPSEQLMIMVDADELRRAVGNLIDNAVRHARTQVAVAVAVDHDHAVISVSDDGPGRASHRRSASGFSSASQGSMMHAGGALAVPVWAWR
jgi:signal transduction histidine kinase